MESPLFMAFEGFCGPKMDLPMKKSPHADLAALRGPEFVTLLAVFREDPGRLQPEPE